jgi:hypothetical protein
VARVKGTALESSSRYVRERFGPGALARVIEALPEGDRAAFHEGILASAWYGLDALDRFMQETERQLSPQEPEVLRMMGRASCEYGLTGVYRVFFKVGSPEWIISKGAQVYSRYYDTGELKIVEVVSGRAIVELVGFEGGSRQFCERFYGWMQRTLELAGAKNLRTAHSTCIHRGDSICLFEGHWGGSHASPPGPP